MERATGSETCSSGTSEMFANCVTKIQSTPNLVHAGRAKVIVREEATKKWCMGSGQAAREVWSRLGSEEVYRSVSIRLAEREAVRKRVARVGQEGLEASARVIELTSDRSADCHDMMSHSLRPT